MQTMAGGTRFGNRGNGTIQQLEIVTENFHIRPQALGAAIGIPYQSVLA
jgi:hypothetical protein